MTWGRNISVSNNSNKYSIKSNVTDKEFLNNFFISADNISKGILRVLIFFYEVHYLLGDYSHTVHSQFYELLKNISKEIFSLTKRCLS